MTLEAAVRTYAELISGTRILDTATDLSRLHRTPASPGFRAAVEKVVARLAEAGVAATVHTFPADGKTKTYDWTAPPAWEVRAGTLREAGESGRLIADFDETAQAVVVHSPGGVFEGEIVHLGSPAEDADYERYDLAGKVALVCARASDAVPRAARRGAVAVVMYPSDERAAVSHELVAYQSIFPRREDIAGLVPAFSVSRRAADRLVRASSQGSLVVRGEIDAEFGDGEIQVVEALVSGRNASSREALFVAHLCHPRGSANDNASGAAALVEIASAMSHAPIASGARFLWAPEFYGTLPWAAERADVVSGVEFVVNLDMVGAHPERIGEPLRIFRASNSTPHFVNAIVGPVAAAVAAARETGAARGSRRPLHWVEDLPSGGSDHVVFAASPHRRAGIMLGHDDPYWHSDQDTADHLDPTRLKQAAVLAAVLAAESTDHGAGAWLWNELLAYSAHELARAGRLAAPLEPKAAALLLDTALDVEIRRARSVRGIEPRRASEREGVLRTLRAHLGPAREPDDEDEGRCPLRRVDGPLIYALGARLSEEENAFFKETFGDHHRAAAEGLLNLSDGTLTATSIARRLTLDGGRLFTREDVERGVDALETAGIVEWRDAS
ncbi:MAG: DUF4910 domain-containing protein [Candidatus Bipolaricaulota bacterium]